MRQFKPGQLQTGSIYPITASSALTASYLLGSISIDTGSLVTTASFNAFTASYTTGSFTGSFIGTLNGTASYATHALTASYARTASYVTPLQQNVIITGSIYIPDNTYSIYFSGSNAASRLTWNDTDGTLDLGLKGGNVTLQIGQEQVVRVVNKTGANLLESEYKVARIRRVDEGGAQGQRLAVVLAQANNDANSVDTLGIVTENIDDNQEGFITNSGLVRNINTTGTLQGETWTDGDVLYLSPTIPGALTTTKPQAPDHTVVMGYVVYAHNNQGKIFVKVDNGYEIDELHNVRITTASLTPGQLLVRSGSVATGVWINTNQLTGSYGLTGSLNANAITGSFTGSFYGDGSQLTGIVSSKWTGSNPISRQSDVTITGSLRTRNTIGSGINTSLGQLIYGDTASVDWRNRYLNDLNDITSIDWHSRNAYDSFGTPSFDWDSRSAWDLNNDVSIDWDNRQLIATDGSTITVDWENGLFTGSLFGTASNAVSSSYAVTASYLDNYIPPFPYTGSALITGSLTVIGPATFYGTASFINVTASNLFISESFISVNVFEPVERFGGLKVYDSGSSAATASLAWDSLHNHWVYQNVDGASYTGGMLLSGPRNTGSLGDEPNLTKWFVPRSDGGDHLDNSQIFTSASITQVTGSLTVTAGITGSLFGNSSTATSASFAATSSVTQRVAVPLGSGYIGQIQANGTALDLNNSSTGVQIRLNSTNLTQFFQPSTFSNGVNITPGANSTTSGLTVTTGSYPSATLLRVGVNDLVVTGSRIGIGTTTPVDAVEIVGYSKYIKFAGTSETDRSAWIGNDSLGTGNVYLFNGTNTNSVFITGNGSSFFNGGNVGIGVFQPSISALLHISGTNASTLLRLDAPGSSNILHVTGSGRVGIGTSTPSSTLNVAGTTILSGSANTISGSILTVIGSGSTQPVFTVQGSQGELFSVTDSLSGSLFSVNDISGLPILEVFSDNTTLIGNYLDPMLITTAKVTQTNSGSFTVYSLPTASYDTAFFEYSVKSGSNARAGTIMAIQSGTSVNYTETTTLDFGSTTAVSFTVIVTGSNMALTGSSTSGAWTIKAIVRGL